MIESSPIITNRVRSCRSILMMMTTTNVRPWYRRNEIIPVPVPITITAMMTSIGGWHKCWGHRHRTLWIIPHLILPHHRHPRCVVENDDYEKDTPINVVKATTMSWRRLRLRVGIEIPITVPTMNHHVVMYRNCDSIRTNRRCNAIQ